MSEIEAYRAMQPSRRVAAQEQYERARWLADLAQKHQDLDRFRLQLAATYAARAVAELLKEAAAVGDIAATREQVDALLSERIPRYFLVALLRIHDFHRYGLRPVPAGTILVQGPMRAKVSRGAAAMWFDPQAGLQTATTGDSEWKLNRALQIRGPEYFDEDTGDWVTLENALADYLGGVPDALLEYDRL